MITGKTSSGNKKTPTHGPGMSQGYEWTQDLWLSEDAEWQFNLLHI